MSVKKRYSPIRFFSFKRPQGFCRPVNFQRQKGFWKTVMWSMERSIRVLCIMSMIVLVSPCWPQPPAPLTFQSAVDLALTNHPFIKAAEKEVQAAIARQKQAGAWSETEIGVSWDAVPSHFNVNEADETAFGLAQTIEFPGKRSSRKALAGHDITLAQLELERQKILLSASVKKAYYTAAYKAKLLQNLDRCSELLDQVQTMTANRFKLHVVPYLEVLRIQVEQARLANKRFDAEQQLSLAVAGLNRCLGRSAATETVLADSLVYIAVNTGVEQALSRARVHSFLLQQHAVRTEQGLAGVSASVKSRLPDLNVGIYSQKLNGQPPYSANGYTGVTKRWYWGLQLGLSVPLFSRAGTSGRVQEARALHEQAVLLQDAMQRQVDAAVFMACKRAEAAQAQVVHVRDILVPQVRAQWQAGLELYRTNQLDYLHLIDLLRTWYETAEVHDAALYHYLLSLVNLEIAAEEGYITGDEYDQ